MFRRHYRLLRNLGSKHDPRERLAPPPPQPRLRRIMPATQATHSISYVEQEFRQIKWPRVIV